MTPPTILQPGDPDEAEQGAPQPVPVKGFYVEPGASGIVLVKA